MDLFLNAKSIDKYDATINGDKNNVIITCEFSDLPESFILDDSILTNFSDELMLNENKYLEVVKEYDGSLATPKIKRTYLNAVNITNSKYNDLLILTNADLKNRANELSIDLKYIDNKINSQIRKKIREHLDSPNLSLTEVNLNDSKIKVINSLLPLFAYFKADRESTDQDDEAQDPLKAAIKEAIKQKESELNAIADYIKTEVQKIAELTSKKLNEMDKALAQSLKLAIPDPKWDTLFKTGIFDEQGIPLNKHGSGVKRLVLLNFFRAKAENKAYEQNKFNTIYAIEEPETSQHPHNQRLLLHSLAELSDENQIIITTHTPTITRCVNANGIRFIKKINDNKRVVLNGGNNDINKEIIENLGILYDNGIKLFIGVEGINDINFLNGISKKLISEGVQNIVDLEQAELNGDIIYLILGGNNIIHWLKRLENFNQPEIHFYDRDFQPPAKAKYQDVADEINSINNCQAFLTSKKELENYIHFEAINEAYSEELIDLNITTIFNDFDDVPIEVAKLINLKCNPESPWGNLDSKKQKDKESNVKRFLNQKAIQKMTSHRLKEIDTNDEIITWLNKISALIIKCT